MFERDWSPFGQHVVQTLEPRAFYVYVPYRNQSQAPVFDTAVDDFNFGQLFSVNRYLGNDRIGDANQLTLALTSRFLDPETGAERLRVAIGERFYFQDQRVVLNEAPRSAATSDVLLGVEGRLSDAWALGALWQYNFDASQTERINAGVRYTPTPGRVLNVSYRYSRQYVDPIGTQSQLNQFDVSGQWPVTETWTLLGRWNYSLLGQQDAGGGRRRRVQCRVLGSAPGRPAADDDDADNDQLGLPADRAERPRAFRHQSARSAAPQRPGLPEDQRPDRVAARPEHRLLSRILRAGMTRTRLLVHFVAQAAMLAAFAAAAPVPTAPAPAAQTPAAPQAPARRPTPAQPVPPARSINLDRTILLDRVVAVVNDEALTQFDLNEQKRIVLPQMKSQNVTPPPPDVLEKQLLERLITERALLQYAKETGVRVDDMQVERTIAARRAGEQAVAGRVPQGGRARGHHLREVPRGHPQRDHGAAAARPRGRQQDQRQRCRGRQFPRHVGAQTGGEIEYRLSHVLVIVPEQASPEQIDAKRRRAEDALKQIRERHRFRPGRGRILGRAGRAARAAISAGARRRGCRRCSPSPVRGMKPGEVSGVLRSSTGFHIVKLQEMRSRNQPTVVEQTHARHILIKVNEITSETEAKAKIDRVKDRIDSGAKFEDQARLNSEDASASKGGDLGWISPGDTVPDFEQAMNKLKIGETSAPVRTPFGWHLIQVIERRTQDITAERQREQARRRCASASPKRRSRIGCARCATAPTSRSWSLTGSAGVPPAIPVRLLRGSPTTGRVAHPARRDPGTGSPARRAPRRAKGRRQRPGTCRYSFW